VSNTLDLQALLRLGNGRVKNLLMHISTVASQEILRDFDTCDNEEWQRASSQSRSSISVSLVTSAMSRSERPNTSVSSIGKGKMFMP
jgi:hypothetical protein